MKLTVQIDDDAKATLGSLVAHYDPFLSAHAVARAAMRLGLQALASEPTRLLDLLRHPNRAEAQG